MISLLWIIPSTALKFNWDCVVEIVLPVGVIFPTSTCPVTSAFVVRAVPFTSRKYAVRS